jgi:hypothetical protein
MKRFSPRSERYFERHRHAQGDIHLIEAVTRHVESHVGPIDFVLHESRSHLVHIDVHHVPPAEGRPFHTLVTSGMSQRAMSVPPDAGETSYAELFALLPAQWNMSTPWPVQLLRELARYPHEWETWLGCGHTVQNGTPADPYGVGVPFCATLLTHPVSLPMEVAQLTHSRRSIHLYQIVTLYREELRFALQHGTDALLARFAQYQVSDLVDPERRNTCRLDVH